MTRSFSVSAAVVLWLAVVSPLSAQPTLTRAEAIRIALDHSSRAAVLASDTTAANAQLRAAHEYPNPTMTVGYSKSVPQNHLSVEVPIELPAVRRARIRAAAATRTSAHHTFLAGRAAIELDVDTLYTHAQVAVTHLDASNATALDAHQLWQLTEARRTAGDASDLDVQLARVNAEQLASVASGDTATAVDAMLELQAAMGVTSDSLLYHLPPILEGAATPVSRRLDRPPLVAPRVAAAEAALAAAQQTLTLQRASVFGTPAIQVGVEGRDPTGSERGLLPTVGVVLPLPLFNWNGGQIAAARADVDRSRAALAVARLEIASQLERASRARASAVTRSVRDGQAAISADSVLLLSRKAYEEGEMTLADVLQAQRTYRDAWAQYQNDLLTLLVNDAILRVYTGQPVTHP
ncbi:MAG TPA: TolC family protein [Gemmatimonadaceae bacterium]|jgi:cobalt-zinc-cadmium efflux system outer membrane protein|nr:TolC family protein [Gemmatimonadaceae bacterium]